ncbi:MAG: prepilin peptidase [Pseudohongiellaceae bacterium]
MTHPTELAPLIVSIMILLPAVVIDFRSRRIPNVLCVVGFLAGAGLHGLMTGWGGVAASCVAGVVVLAVMFPLFVIGWFGAGDVKLVAAMGAVAGSVTDAAAILATVFIAGGLLALLMSLYHRGPKQTFWNFHIPVNLVVVNRHTADCPDASIPLVLPYSLAIAGGSVFVLTMNVFGAG